MPTRFDFQVPTDAPDPGVQFLGGRWVMASTGGAPRGGAFVIRESDDLVHWRDAGSVFTAADKPSWSDGITYWVRIFIRPNMLNSRQRITVITTAHPPIKPSL